jgi:hypothetical protein
MKEKEKERENGIYKRKCSSSIFPKERAVKIKIKVKTKLISLLC